MSTAEFTINDSDFSDGIYEAVLGEALAFALAAAGTDIRKVEFSVVGKAKGDLALAGLPAQPTTPGGSVNTTAPVLGPGSYVLQCQLNDGGLPGADGKVKPIADWTKQRLVVVRATTGKRKLATGESTQAGVDGWAGERSDDVVAFDRLDPNFNRQLCWVRPKNGTAVSEEGLVLTSSGTISHPALATTSVKDSLRRARWTSGVAANDPNGFVTAHELPAWRGNALGLGGFTFFARFAANTNVNGSRFFVGLSAKTGNMVTVDPSSENHTIGVGWDAADSSGGNWQFIHKDTGAAVKLDLGLARGTTDLLDLFIHCKPNDSVMYVRFRRVTAAGYVDVLNSSVSATLPGNTQFLRMHAGAGPAATGAAAEIDLMAAYLEVR